MGILQHPGSGEDLGRFSSQLRDALASKAKPFDLWSIPESAAGPQDEDCPYDMESQSYEGESHMPMDEDMEYEADAGWAVETKSVADHVPEGVHYGETGSPVSIGKCLRCLGDLNARVLSIEEQLEKQNFWNDDMGRGVESMQGGYQEISALREEVATLKEQLNALGRGSPGSGRKPGRPRRVAQ
ncbi:hypothetical protein PENANT_c093G08111 [Penicillium antarcticum]|uniref:Uncharacterized protein n=1 Tax=Penicillium antarcticum TaxID=416450 RepID=A0A1V6PM59_9EURO|nr:hypothetical protein PENANT_c150G10910 [Penicillium antarcticum]OQD76776.1 hypothetical protein PENANT_c117G07831 [Penicillium antarcticum]OQD78061.1 hypothetical protein PENANT_c093G08111 [Penicillium antarcticum]